jgi:hypothetical protein
MSEPMQPPHEDLRGTLRRIIRELRLPAGSDPRFATPAGIAANLTEFTAAVHSTWKDIQAEAIREIVTLEILLAKGDFSTKPKGSAGWLRYLLRLWRRVNDAVAWSLLGQREMVRQLCQHRVRPTLIESNPQSVAAVLDDINRDPQSIAIWNDATTFLDVGDITARRHGQTELDFIEIKQGDINLEILKLNEAMILHRRAGEPGMAEAALDAFFTKHGRRGFKQLMRVTKQLMGDTGIMEAVNDRLSAKADLDPDIDIEATISDAIAESYDPELTAMLRRADAEGLAFGCIDGCLWIYICAESAPRQEAIAEFSRQVFEASPETKAWLLEKMGRDQLHPVTSVHQWAFVPTALPIFLRLLEPEDIVELLLGKLAPRVLLFFDWLRFETVVARTGCALTWVRPKPIAGKNLHEIIGRKTPRIGRQSGQGLRLGKMFVSQFFADGLRPASIATQCAEMLRRTADAP